MIAPAPPMPFLPPEYYGLPVLLASIVYAGPPEKAEQVLAPFRAVATPLADMLRPMSYPEIFPPEDPTYHPVAVSRNLFLDEFDRRAAETIVHGLESSTAPMRACQIRVLGGAVARVPMDATAYAFRDRPIMVNVAALYGPDGDPTPHREWVESLTDKLRGADRSAYVNFMGDEGPTRVWDAYPRSTWERLAAVKARYDPGNLFRLNHNIQPARREARP